MQLEKFRITHSTLIEHYQFIELHLEGIYAAICGKPLLEGLKEVEKDGLTGILQDILRMERERNMDVLSDAECDQLRQLFQRRNYWCHSCYHDMAFDRQTGGPANLADAQSLYRDLQAAEQWRDRLYNKKCQLLDRKRRGL